MPILAGILCDSVPGILGNNCDAVFVCNSGLNYNGLLAQTCNYIAKSFPLGRPVPSICVAWHCGVSSPFNV